MSELWREVKGYEDFYLISNSGRVRSLHRNKEIILSPRITKLGYVGVNLSRNGKSKAFLVHRLVAIAFCENKELKREVNHIDGNKQNNSFENLEWSTRSENVKHAIRTGLKSVRRGTANNINKLSNEDVFKIRKLISNEVTNSKISKMFKIDPSTVSDIKRRKSWAWLN